MESMKQLCFIYFIEFVFLLSPLSLIGQAEFTRTLTPFTRVGLHNLTEVGLGVEYRPNATSRYDFSINYIHQFLREKIDIRDGRLFNRSYNGFRLAGGYSWNTHKVNYFTFNLYVAHRKGTYEQSNYPFITLINEKQNEFGGTLYYLLNKKTVDFWPNFFLAFGAGLRFDHREHEYLNYRVTWIRYHANIGLRFPLARFPLEEK